MTISMSQVAKRADEFFAGESPVHRAMHRLANALRGMEIPFAFAGGMAVNVHGHQQTTDQISLLIRKEDLERFKASHLGLGWVDKFEGSKNFRDAVCNVNIDALIVGQFPGDGLPKPVAFPAPESVVQPGEDGIPYISLKTLLELKLASGMTAPHRMQDLADVMQLIRANSLPVDYAKTLNPYVADKFGEMWQAAQIRDDY